MKLIFTLMFLFAATFMLKAQVIFEDQDTLANFEGAFNPTLESYTGEDPSVTPNLTIVPNPKKDDVNSSANVFVFARIDDGNSYSHKSGIVFKFNKSYDQFNQSYIHLKCYSPDRSTCFRFTYYLDDVVVKDDWIQSNIDCNGKWAYLAYKITDYGTYNKIRIETSDAWGSTATPGVVYIDDLELYNEKVGGYLPAFKGMVFNAKKVSKAPTIDGSDQDDCWTNATFAPIDKLNSGDGTGIGGEWAASWDKDYLYLFLKVTDDILWKWSNQDWAGWKGDGFQCYLDVLSRRLDGRTFGNLSGFDFAPDRDSGAAMDAGKGYATSLGGFGDDGKGLALQGSTITGSDYTIELAYPWIGLATGAGTDDMPDPASWIAENVKSGLEIAFDLQLNDDDGSGRVNMLSWASEPKEPYGNSGTWGGIKLEGSTGIAKNTTDFGAKVYPTITNTILNISMQSLKKIEIIDITGKLLVTKTAKSNNERFDVSSLQNGIYLVRMSDGINSSVQRFLKN
jgi:hypothetical protein